MKTALQILEEIGNSTSTEETTANYITPIFHELKTTTETILAASETNEVPNIKIEQRLIETNNKNYNKITNQDKPSNTIAETEETSEEYEDDSPVPCTCGVFLSGQFKKGSKEQPKGVPVLTQEMDTPFMNNAMGNRQCTNKCLELVRIFFCFFFVGWICFVLGSRGGTKGCSRYIINSKNKLQFTCYSQ